MLKNNLLLVRPYPKLLESWRGYILRLSEENAANNPRRLLQLRDVDVTQFKSLIPSIEYIASISGKSFDYLSPIYLKKIYGEMVSYLGHSLPKEYIRFNSPHLCTVCVKENGYLHARWDFIYMNVCHVHKKRLLTHCPSCLDKLSWNRPGLLKCKCGYDLSEYCMEAASEQEVFFTDCLNRVIESNLNDLDIIESPIPVDFYKLSLKTLLGMFNVLGTRRVLANGGAVKLNNFGDNRVYSEGVSILNNWDSEFKKLMIDSARKPKNESSSIRKNFESFHNAIFKKNFPSHEIQFIEKAYLKYSLELIDVPTLDSRIKSRFSIQNDEVRWMGIYQASEMLGVMASTMRRMVKAGIVKSKLIKKSSRKSVWMVDISSIVVKKLNDKGELETRAAAAYVGLPVSVIKSLRESGHLKSKYRTVYPTSWSIPDLNDFLAALYESALKSDLDACKDRLELKYTIQNLRLNSTEMKADIVRAVLNGNLRLFAESQDIKKMYLSKEELDNFISTLRISKTNKLTIKEIASLIGLDQSCAKSFQQSNLFRNEFSGRQYFYNKDDIEQFHSEFIAISRLSAKLKMGINKLLKLINQKNISTVDFMRLSGIRQSFVKRHEIEQLQLSA